MIELLGDALTTKVGIAIKDDLVSLQKLNPFNPKGFLDFRGVMKDWNQTAALVDKLDLVISVDTSIAHLAGALGKLVWLLIPEEPEWRWGKFGQVTTWYPSMRIFRVQGGDIIEQVMMALKEL